MSLAEDLNEGQRLWAAEKWDEAMARYLSALAQEPRQFTAMRRLWKRGTTTQDLGLFSRVLEVVPKPSGHQDVDLYLARMARMLGRPEQTEQFRSQVERQCRESIRGGSADQWMSQKLLGNVLRDFGGEAQLRESVEVFGGSLANAPPAEHAGVHNDRGMTYRCLGSLADAERDFRDAIRLKGDITEAHTNLAQALLLQGKLEEGWREWEWRFGPPGRPPAPCVWTGKHVLIRAEQGNGDQIQMVRFLPRVREASARVTLQCGPSLRNLFRDSGIADAVVERGAPPPRHDVAVPVMSLPLAFNTSLDDLRGYKLPYLRAHSGRLPPLVSEAINRTRPGKRVGLTWAGTPFNANDHNRSCPLAVFEPLIRIPGIDWFSLQVGRDAETDRLREWGVTDLGPHIRESFAATAATLEQLDLVVAVDTSIAHLAGALRKPTCVALPFDPDWRWLRAYPDSPWYLEIVHLFRQTSLGTGGAHSGHLQIGCADGRWTGNDRGGRCIVGSWRYARWVPSTCAHKRTYPARGVLTRRRNLGNVT